jgi:hypothetical protein
VRGRLVGIVVGLVSLVVGLTASTTPTGAQAPPSSELPLFVRAAQAAHAAEGATPPEPLFGGATAPAELTHVGGPEATSISVTPDTGLLDGQTVTISGDGWAPRQYLFVAECAEGVPLNRGCEFLGDARAGVNGHFTAHFPLDVVVDTADRSVDCRVDTCLVAVGGFSAASVRTAAVAFDPAGPDPTRYTVDADPDTGLLDGDEVTITGEGFPSDPDFGLAQVSMCQAPVDARSDCDRGETTYIEVDGGGHAEGTVRVRAVLHLPSGDVDCRVASCALVVEPEPFFLPTGDSELSEAGIAPIAFDPAGPLQPPPVLTADPSTGLADGDEIVIEGSHFDADSGVRLGQCPAGATRWQQCVGGVIMFGPTGPSGEFRFRFPVQAQFRDGFNRPVDCRTTSCSVIAGHGDLGRHAEAVIEFDADAPLLQPTIEVSPSTGLADGDVVHVIGHDFPSVTPVEILQCPSDAADQFACDLNHSILTGFEDAPGLEVLELSSEPPTEATQIDADYEVRARFVGPEGPVDCRRRQCEIWALPFGRDDPARARIDFSDAPTAPPPIAGSPAFTG